MKSAFLWSAVRNWAPRIGTIITFLVIARILEPAEIGAVVAAMAVIAFIELLTDAGLGDAVVQARRKSRATLTAVSLVNLGLAIGILAALVAFAQPIANALQSPESAPYIRVLALVVPLNALGLVPVALLRRSFGFRRLAMRSMLATLISCTLGVSLVLTGFGAWSMVIQALAFSSINLVLVLFPAVLKPRRPRFAAMGPLVRFGSHILLSRLLYFASTRALEFAIPILFGAGALGIYFMASRVPAVFAQIVSGVMVDVNLPRFSQAKGNPEVFRTLIRNSITVTSAIAAPIFFGLASTSTELAVILFADKGSAVAPAFFPVAILCGIQAVGFYNQLILNAQGLSRLGMVLSMINATVSLSYFVAGQWIEGFTAFVYGFVGVQAALIASATVVTSRKSPIPLGCLICGGLPFYGAALVATVATHYARVALPDAGFRSVLVDFILMGATFAVVYAGTLLLTHRRTTLKTYLSDLAGLKRFAA